LLRRRARSGDGVNSISHFHRQLRVLEHSAPQPIVAPAYRLRAVAGSAGAGARSAADGPEVAPVLTVVGANDLPKPALAFLGEDPEPAALPTAGRPGSPASPRSGAAPSRPGPWAGGSRRPEASLSRRRACRRRRDTLAVLSLTVVLSALIGLVPGAHLVWAVAAVAGVALVGYVALLVHLRRVAEEREHTLAYLRPATSGADLPPGMAEPSAHIGGRYAHPAYQAAAGH
jgi:hypothetical protein